MHFKREDTETVSQGGRVIENKSGNRTVQAEKQFELVLSKNSFFYSQSFQYPVLNFLLQ